MASAEKRRPRAGIDYPRDRVEFDEFFPDDKACWEYLEHLRWPEDFICPRCDGHGDPWRTNRGLLVCPSCRKHVSVTAGTIFHRTRTPLRMWFLVAWEITSHKYGASALGAQRALGIKSYKTAWVWLHKYRRAMVRPGRDQLNGFVEVDEAYVGGEEAAVSGRETLKKAIVVIAVELNQQKVPGRVRLRHVPDVSAESLLGFVSDVVAPGSTIHTDGWGAYSGLTKRGYKHEVTVLAESVDPAHVAMPGVHLVSSL